MEGKPFLQWSADILELPEDEEGHKYVLVMTDQFNKWVEAFPLKRQTAEEVARCVVEVICRFGIMKSLLTDQGGNFESALIKGVCQLMGVKKLRTSIYHPRSNGQVERVNRSLLELLTHYVAENQRDWHLWLPVVTSAYNSGRHSSTGYAPCELVYGRQMRSRIEDEFEVGSLKKQTHRHFLAKLKKHLQGVHQQALELIQRQQRLRTSDSQPATFHAGETVWCRNFTAGKGVQGKLKPTFEGPYVVVEARPPDYVVKKGRRKRLIHGYHLKRQGEARVQDQPIEVTEDGKTACELDYWQGDDSREDPTVDNSVGVKPAQVRPETSDGRKAVPGSGQLTSSEVTGEQTQQPERRESAAENLPVPDDTGAAGRESQDGGGSPGLTEEDGTRPDEATGSPGTVAPSGAVAEVAPPETVPGEQTATGVTGSTRTRCGREIRRPRRYLD